VGQIESGLTDVYFIKQSYCVDMNLLLKAI